MSHQNEHLREEKDVHACTWEGLKGSRYEMSGGESGPTQRMEFLSPASFEMITSASFSF